MSDDSLAQMHEALREPLRQKILLKLGEHASLGLDDLVKGLNYEDSKELSYQLGILERLSVEGEHLLSMQPDGKYSLTAKGHYVLEDMIIYPELESESYREDFGKTARSNRRGHFIFIGAIVGFLFWLMIVFLEGGILAMGRMESNGGYAFTMLAVLITSMVLWTLFSDFIGKKVDYKYWRG